LHPKPQFGDVHHSNGAARELGFVIPEQVKHYDVPMPYQPTLRLALIAHDAKKADIVSIATDFRAFLATCKLCATGTTGTRIAQATGLKIERFLSGPMGGDLQIGARLASGKIDGVIFQRAKTSTSSPFSKTAATPSVWQ
jgi:hypothetical protein